MFIHTNVHSPGATVTETTKIPPFVSTDFGSDSWMVNRENKRCVITLLLDAVGRKTGGGGEKIKSATSFLIAFTPRLETSWIERTI